MGQKVHPYGLRLGIIRPWLSRWFAEDARYREQLIEDVRIRKLVRERLRNASVSQITIERTADTVTITVRTAKPGVVIGRSGSGVDRLNKEIQQATGRKVHLTVEEVKRPELDAQLVAESIASQIERRISFRRAMRQALQRTMKAGGQGIKIKVSGRLGGAEIAHSETAKSPTGRVPLHTLRADVDYGLAEARTNQGNIGVKVWIYRGDIMPERRRREFEEARERLEVPGAPPRRDVFSEPETAETSAETQAKDTTAPSEAVESLSQTGTGESEQAAATETPTEFESAEIVEPEPEALPDFPEEADDDVDA